MFKYIMLPLNEHVDYGFGAVADEYRDAANRLLEKDLTMNQHLPVLFLMRHGVELYLKSAVIFHNKIIEFSDGENYAIIKNSTDGLTSIEKIHDISQLYNYVASLIDANRKLLSSITGEDWDMPSDIQRHISKISKFDKGGDFFRYPSVRANKKAKQKSYSKRLEGIDFEVVRRGPQKSILIVERGNDVDSVFDLARNPGEEYLHHFQVVLEGMYTFHAAMVGLMWDKIEEIA